MQQNVFMKWNKFHDIRYTFIAIFLIYKLLYQNGLKLFEQFKPQKLIEIFEQILILLSLKWHSKNDKGKHQIYTRFKLDIGMENEW